MQRVDELNGWSDYWNVAAMEPSTNFKRVVALCNTFKHNEMLINQDLGNLRTFVAPHLDAPFARIITNSLTIFNDVNLMSKRGNVRCSTVLVDCCGTVLAENRYQDASS